MNKALKITLIATGTIILGSILLLAGIIIGRGFGGPVGFWPVDMMAGYTTRNSRAYQPGTDIPAYQYGYGVGTGMMGNYARPDYINQDEPDGGPDNYGYHYGMGPGMMGGRYGHNPGMMVGFYPGELSDAEPLSLEQAQIAVEDFLADLGDKNLILEEVMIFENHAYAQILEESTGIGAMEVLIDPVTLAVYPEHGPNMMWNLKYGMMATRGGHGAGMVAGGMMGGYGFGRGWNNPVPEVSAAMPVSPEQAIASAQSYLDEYQPGLEADEHADQFYGYYTLHVLEDGEVAGMLSVNGYTQQVFPHTWHGKFIEMSGE